MFLLSFDNNRFLVFWRFDDQKDNIFIHLRVKTTGWIGFGFAETEQTNMMNYDVIVAGYSNGQGYLNVSFTHTSSDVDRYLNLLHLHFTSHSLTLCEKISWRLSSLFKNLPQHTPAPVRRWLCFTRKKDAIKGPKNKEIQGDKEGVFFSQ